MSFQMCCSVNESSGIVLIIWMFSFLTDSCHAICFLIDDLLFYYIKSEIIDMLYLVLVTLYYGSNGLFLSIKESLYLKSF